MKQLSEDVDIFKFSNLDPKSKKKSKFGKSQKSCFWMDLTRTKFDIFSFNFFPIEKCFDLFSIDFHRFFLENDSVNKVKGFLVELRTARGGGWKG